MKKMSNLVCVLRILNKMKDLFKKSLVEGIILPRPNRFIMLVEKSGQIHKCHYLLCDNGEIGIDVKPHDLRRHAATYASRSRVPIEIVSKIIVRDTKIILRHSNLSTTQRYLGKVSDTEAMYWIENIYR